jgi:hypothetical protein
MNCSNLFAPNVNACKATSPLPVLKSTNSFGVNPSRLNFGRLVGKTYARNHRVAPE